MKKILLTVLILLTIVNLAYAREITFTIDDLKIQRIIDAMKGLYPIPTDENGNPLYTDNQWAKEAIRRWIIFQVQRWEIFKAREAVNVPIEDDLID